MTDYELVHLFRDCYERADKLGLRLDAKNDVFQIIRGEDIIISKVGLSAINMFLEGYKCGLTAR